MIKGVAASDYVSVAEVRKMRSGRHGKLLRGLFLPHHGYDSGRMRESSQRAGVSSRGRSGGPVSVGEIGWRRADCPFVVPPAERIESRGLA